MLDGGDRHANELFVRGAAGLSSEPNWQKRTPSNGASKRTTTRVAPEAGPDDGLKDASTGNSWAGWRCSVRSSHDLECVDEPFDESVTVTVSVSPPSKPGLRK
jgi:hypothetical protein